MSTGRRQRFHYEVPTHAAKYPLAALIEGFAAAVLRHLYQKAPDGLYTVHQIVEFRELSLRQLLPSIRGPSDIAEAEE
jgi:sulfur transfer protein SufE